MGEAGQEEEYHSRGIMIESAKEKKPITHTKTSAFLVCASFTALNPATILSNFGDLRNVTDNSTDALDERIASHVLNDCFRFWALGSFLRPSGPD